MTQIVKAGNYFRAAMLFVPDPLGPAVALADVTCRWTSRRSTGDVTPNVITTGVNAFQVDILIPDTEPSNYWQIRWESNPPSPKIVVEDDDCRIWVEGAVHPVP